MAVTWTHHVDEKYLEIHLTGKLERKDYDEFVPQFERLIHSEGPLRLLCALDDFHGWTAGGLWEDIKFDVKHFNDVKRIAMVGDRRWQEWMAAFCKPFTTAKIEYFAREALPAARRWLTESSTPEPAPAQTASR
jgi:SpoIIAA-like